MPQLGVDALTVSVIPGDVGKPTVKLDKATVRDGTCRWENPVYETVKFFREPRTGKISERIFHFIVSTVWIFASEFASSGIVLMFPLYVIWF